jgi:glycosyltransferase involved in cell wall biosynthesis/protein-tyrosine-phosphatase
MTTQAQHVAADAVAHTLDAPRPLRICHIVSADSWAGAEVQVATTAAYLIERPSVSLTAVLLNEGSLAHELRRLGVPMTVVDERRTSAVGILRFLTRFLKANDIELVHTHRYKESVLGTIAAKLAGVPYVVRTVHGLREPMTGWNGLKFRVYEALDKATLLCFADLVIAVSKRMADTLRDSGYRPTTVTHVHNGVHLRKVCAARNAEHVRRELGLEQRTLVIGTAGRLSPVKAHLGLLRAATLILQKEPSARFLIAGGGPLRDDLLAAAARLHIDDKCLFVGPRADVYDLMSAMDIFVLPSLDEGIPMAILEAMALGKPVVATAVGGIPEVVHHRVTGLLVAPGDEQALADACLELALDRDWAQALGARAKRKVQEEFTHESNGQALLAAYRSVTLVPKSGAVRVHERQRGGFSEHVGVLTLCWGLTRKLLEYVTRRVGHAVERRRMKRIRRNPTALRTALRSAKSLLVVCHGNIIRSPFAACLVAQALGEQRTISISSAGLEAMSGRSPHPTALLTATKRSVDLSGHTASRLSSERVATSDMIFVMDIPQLVALRKRFPEAAGKTFLLTCLAPEAPMEIEDPVEGGESVFQACFDHISRAVSPIARVLSGSAPPR